MKAFLETASEIQKAAFCRSDLRACCFGAREARNVTVEPKEQGFEALGVAFRYCTGVFKPVMSLGTEIFAQELRLLQ